MPNINPFPASSFQSVFDSFLVAMKWVWTPEVLSTSIMYILVVGLVGVVAFGLLGLGFRAFVLISDKTFARTDEAIDGFLGSKPNAKFYEKNIKSWKLKRTNEGTRKKDIGHIVDSM